jgi:hypothetical protein
MLNELGPALDRVMLVAELLVPTVKVPKLTLLVLNDTMVPVPLRATVWGLLLAFPATVREAERAPTACGVSRKLTVQVELAASVVPQVLEEIEKSAAFAPVTEIELMVNVAAPVLRTVTELVEEFVRYTTVPKLIALGESEIRGMPVDVKLTPVTFAPLTVFDWLAGLKVYPVLLGVTV